MVGAAPHGRSLRTNARVLPCIAEDPRIRLREIGDRVGITERAARTTSSPSSPLAATSRARAGRRNNYTIHPHRVLPDRLDHEQRIGDILAILTARDPTPS